MRSNCLMGTGFPSGMVKYSGTRQRWWLHNSCGCTGLFTLKLFISHVNLSQFLKSKNKTKQEGICNGLKISASF